MSNNIELLSNTENFTIGTNSNLSEILANVVRVGTDTSNVTISIPQDISSSYNLILPVRQGVSGDSLVYGADGQLTWHDTTVLKQIVSVYGDTLTGNVVSIGTHDSPTYLDAYTANITPKGENSKIFAQFKVNYHAALSASNQISFFIKKSYDGNETIFTESLFGPYNGAGGFTGQYISNLVDEALSNNQITYQLGYKINGTVDISDTLGILGYDTSYNNTIVLQEFEGSGSNATSVWNKGSDSNGLYYNDGTVHIGSTKNALGSQNTAGVALELSGNLIGTNANFSGNITAYAITVEEAHIGPNTLYINGTRVLNQNQDTGSVNVYTDQIDSESENGLTIRATGNNGNIILDPSGTGSIQLNGDVQLSGGNLNAETFIGDLSGNVNAVTIAATNNLSLDGILTTSNSSRVEGNLIPSVDDTYSLGAPDRVWKDVYIGPGSLYLNGTKILDDSSDTINMRTDIDQALNIQTSGTGTLTLRSDSVTQINSGNTSANPAKTGTIILNANGGSISVQSDLVLQGSISMSQTGTSDVPLNLNDDVDVGGNLDVHGKLDVGGNLKVNEIHRKNINYAGLYLEYVKIDGTEITGQLTGNVTGHVTGTVSSLSNLDTDYLTEGSTNQYYTTTRVRSDVSGGLGINYNESTGVFSLPQEVSTNSDVNFNTVTTGELTGNVIGDVTGTVSSLSNLDTDDLSEGSTNLYYTTTRVRGDVSGGTGINYIESTGVFSLPQEVSTNSDVNFNTVTTGELTGNVTGHVTGTVSSLSNLDTDYLTEGSTNQYYTTTHVRSDVSGGLGINYNESTGVFSLPQEVSTNSDVNFNTVTTGELTGNVIGDVTGTVSSLSNLDTDDLSEGSTNLYYTTTRVRGDVSGGTGINYIESTGVFSLPQEVSTNSDVNFNTVTTGELTGNVTGHVTGTVSSLSNLDTDYLTEGSTNQYYTTTHVRSDVSGGLGINYNESTGVFSLPQEVSTNSDVNFNTVTTGELTGNVIGDVTGTVSSLSNLDTDDLSEGSTNLYYTTTRVRGDVSGGTGINYIESTGVFSLPQEVSTNSDVNFNTVTTGELTGNVTGHVTGTVSSLSNLDTDYLTEGSTNQYYTTTHVRSDVSGGLGINYNESTGVFSLPQEVSTTSNVQFNTVTTVELQVTGTTAQIDNNLVVNNDLTVAGNITVNGTQTIVNSRVVEIGDNKIVLNAGGLSSNDAGIIANVNGVEHEFVYTSSNNAWGTTGDLNIGGNVTTTDGYFIGDGSQLTGINKDQPVTLTGNGSTSITGTYPDFTISSTNTTYSAGTGVALSGTTFSIGQSVGTNNNVEFNHVTTDEVKSRVSATRLVLNPTNARIYPGHSVYPNYNFEFNIDTLSVYNGNTPSGLYLNYNGGAVYYGNPTSALSDDRIKFNETNITNGLEVIRKLSPERYTKRLPNQTTGIEEAGFIAQEVIAIPELKFAVTHPNKEITPGDPNTRYYAVTYDSIFTYAVAGLKELDIIVQNQQTLINEQNTKIQELETENAIIKNALNQLLSEAGKPTI